MKKTLAIVLFVAAMLLAACGAKGFTQAELDAKYQEGFDAGKASVQCPAADVNSCQGFVNAALQAVVYDATTCSSVIATERATWDTGLPQACTQAGYSIQTLSSALGYIKNQFQGKAGDWKCYQYYPPVATSTPPPKTPKPPCPTCPTPPPGCPTCPTPP